MLLYSTILTLSCGKLNCKGRFRIVDFGSKLKELRIRSGLTQKQLGEQIGVTKSVISFYEHNDRTPSPDVLIKITSVFHVTSDYLLGIERNASIDISGLTEEDERVVRYMVEILRKKNQQ